MRRRRRRGGFKLNFKTIAMIVGGYFFLTRHAHATQEAVNYWVDASGNVTYAPGITPPPGAIRPASEYEIEQSQGTM